MILSSADILRILGGSEIIRLSARLKVVDKKPVLSGDEYLYVCVGRFPSVDEFQATWRIWVEGDGEEELVVEEIKRLLPSVKVNGGLVTELTTTDFLSESTQRAPEAPKEAQSSIGAGRIEERFQELSEDISDRMLLVSNGKDGAAGADGRDGSDGKDGRDLLATDAKLFDLKDAGPSAIGLKKGQVLTWDGSQWTNLYVPTSSTVNGGGGGSSDGGGGSPLSVQERAGVDGSPENTVPDVTKLSFNTNNGFSVTDLGDGEALVNLGSAFAPWHVEGQETLAPEGEEPVEFVAGPGIQITTNPNAYPQQITITSAGGGGGDGQINSDTIVSESAPTEREYSKGPLQNGDSWFKVSSKKFYVYSDGVWHLVSGSGSGGGGGGSNLPCDGILDGGNADDGTSDGLDCDGCSGILDGGNADDGSSSGVECDDGSGGVEFPEAPIDGKQYARQDADWTEVAPGGIEEAPADGNFYVRHNGAWVNLSVALSALDNRTIDGGDFITGSSSGDDEIVDGGSFT